MAIRPLRHEGIAWSLFPPGDVRGGLNVVYGARRISADILAVLCIRPGEVPFQPGLGISPELFEPLSGKQPQYYRFKMTEAIRKYVKGIQELDIEFLEWRDYENYLNVSVTFAPLNEVTRHNLTFGYYSYAGPDWRGGSLLRDIHLDNSPVQLLR